MSRILLFGGSFNPITNGHLHTARVAATKLGFGEVIFIPCAPHKKSDYADYEHRLEMLKLAIAPYGPNSGNPGVKFDFSTFERGIEGRPSYTIDTVQHFRDYGFRDIHWLIGSDNVEKSRRWYRFHELKKICKFVIVNRPGFEIDKSLLVDHNAVVIDGEPLITSSTEIRQRIQRGVSYDELTSPEVVHYISRHNLYRKN